MGPAYNEFGYNESKLFSGKNTSDWQWCWTCLVKTNTAYDEQLCNLLILLLMHMPNTEAAGLRRNLKQCIT